MNWEIVNTLKKYNKIILVWWGTGGHIHPILSLVKILERENIFKKWNFEWIGWEKSNEEAYAKRSWIIFHTIPTIKISTTRSPKVLLYPIVLLSGIIQSRKILKREIMRENICVFSKGWPGSVAVGIAAWTLNIPLYIHESDTIPGRSNILLWKIANKVFLGFEITKKYFHNKNISIVWQIIHPIFDKNNLKNAHFGLTWKTELPHILVICGSQGAKSIFEAIWKQFQAVEDYEWIIALGKLNSDMQLSLSHISNMQAVEWIEQENIASLLKKTDISITRGSATTLAEIDTFWVRKIIVPLPHAASNHQYYNALEYEKKNDIVLEQKNISELSKIIYNYFSDAKSWKWEKTR